MAPMGTARTASPKLVGKCEHFPCGPRSPVQLEELVSVGRRADAWQSVRSKVGSGWTT